ncbi:unnamed protein product [Blepharisma stoltei]|uniref:Serine aminopeptidase S33 domain-containing protein n=1 Tax=Blepharisma stoltei TaxID=1481888 RepID=A0AAU9JWS5_9CILI|nr:unnamed protein product [Blepharisma stoltei]
METFTNRNGLKLAYKFSIKNPEDKRIYIVLQSVFFDMDFLIYSFFSQNLEVNTFRFDFPGNGKSDGEFTYAGHISEAGDIDDVVKFLVSRGYIVEGIIGHSKSASVSIIYSALYGEVKTIIAIAPVFFKGLIPDYMAQRDAIINSNGEVLRYAFGCTRKMIQEILKIDMKYYCQRARNNIYILQGYDDENIEYSDSLEFVKELGGRCKGHFGLNCDHMLTGVLDDVVTIISQIIRDS